MEPTARSAVHAELLANLTWVQALARRLVGDPAADDVEQDVWLKALERPPRARSGPGLRAWLARVTRTLARQDVRTSARRDHRERRAARPEAEPSTLSVVERGEAQRLVSAAVMELDEPERTAVLLRYLDGLSAVEIARRLGENPAAVRKRLSRALEKLRARLEQELGGERELRGALLPLALAAGGAGRRAGLAAKAAAAVAAVTLVSVGWWLATGSGGAEELVVEGGATVAAAPGPQAPAPAAPIVREDPSHVAAAPDAVQAAAGGALIHAADPGPAAPVVLEDSLLAAVPESAFALVHVRDVPALRSRAERNDWVTLAASEDGEPALAALAREYESATGTDFEGLVALALELSGEAVLFTSGEVAGFLTDPPADRAALAEVLDGWLVDDSRRTVEVGSARVQLGTWPELPGQDPRHSGQVLAYLDHPQVLGLYSGDSAEAVLAALTEGLGALGTDRRAPVVRAWLDAGGGTTGGVEAYVDFTPLVPAAERALAEMVAGVLPDPTGLLGLERGTWLFATADVSPGTRVELDARVRIPEGTLAARLADCFEALPATLPAELPGGTWSAWALHFDLARFWATARTALEAAQEDGLQVVDQGLAAAEALAGVDPVEDLVAQLAGLFALYLVTDPEDAIPSEERVAFLVGLADVDRFTDAIEALLEASGLAINPVELEGAEAWLPGQDAVGFDGGFAILPDRLLGTPRRSILVRGLRALAGVEGAGLPADAQLQGAFDENAGASGFAYSELSHLRAQVLGPEVPAPRENDPFDSRLIGAAARTKAGFELRLYTR